MTRPEFSGQRDLTFSGWIRKNLPDSSTGFLVTDLDFIIFNYKEKFIFLLEIKTRNASLKFWQKSIMQNLASWIEKGIDKDWIFGGFHIIRFENTNFQDGKCFYDDNEITEEELKKILSVKIIKIGNL